MACARRLFFTMNKSQLSASQYIDKQAFIEPKPHQRYYSSSSAETSSATTTAEAKSRTVVFSGIQPTGSMHLGNYFGAVYMWTKIQNDPHRHLYACIVDLHSMSMPWNVNNLRTNIQSMQLELLACGLDPAKCTLFRQSDVPEHCELAWILTCISTMARLDNMPQYKEKSKTLREIPGGLFIYPVLQAADILLYKTKEVPVGDDNVHNLQLAQHFSHKFNNHFNAKGFFPRPVQIVSRAPRVLSLRDPLKKMSKSDADPRCRIEITDTPDVIREKVKKAVTDTEGSLTFDEQNRPGVANLLRLYAVCNFDGNVDNVMEHIARNNIVNKVQLKTAVADAIIEFLRPVQTRYAELSRDLHYVEKVFEDGARRARQVAANTMSDVRRLVGLKNLFKNEFQDRELSARQ